MGNLLTVRVTDAPFSAKGDGVTNDREAIQNAIEYVYKNGGGTVILDEDKTFVCTNIIIKSNVTLFFGEGAMLLQKQGTDGFVKPVGDGYEPYTPILGHNYSETIKWSHTWYKNYPFIFAPEGSHDFKITGKGIIRMSECTDGDKVVRTCPIGFYRVHDFEISDITITNYHGYAMMPFTCSNGLIKNIQIREWCFGNGDGVCLMNCRNMHITGCTMFTGDDSIYIFSSYKDPRQSEWWSSEDPQPSENIEIDNNDLTSHYCKAFGMILWGVDCDDYEKIEIRNIYVHDNKFKTMGNWNYNPYTTKTDPHPVTNVRFENNEIEAIESNFFETPVSCMTGFRSMRTVLNGNFEHGKVYWMLDKNNNDDSVKIVREEIPYALISHTAEGTASLYEGLYISENEYCSFFARGLTSGITCRMFVRNAKTGETVAEKLFCNTEEARTELLFKVPESANYLVGIENADNTDGFIRLYEAEFAGNCDTGLKYSRITKNGGKILYYV